MKYYIVAGEASGDLHASNLIRELKRLDPNGKFRAWGGDKVQSQGAELVMHYRHMGFMGFIEVLANLRTILGLISQCKQDIKQFKPDVVILVDYPGFNFRIARFAKKSGIKVFYYISPQVWAWNRSRVFQVKKWVDHMFVILPFEKAFYNRFNIDADFVGHPLLDAINSYKKQKDSILILPTNKRPVIALLPGSRKQEVSKMLPVMLKVIPLFPSYSFVVAGASSLPVSFYNNIIGSHQAEVVFDKTYALLNTAKAALVTSGTATLETALFRVPQVVCYKGSYISYKIAKQLVKIRYISLVNLIMDRPVVKELIQSSLNQHNITRELDHLLNNESVRQEMISNYTELEDRLGGPGASARAANLMLKYLTESS
jgi:lipid-A-disaccharide synthase